MIDSFMRFIAVPIFSVPPTLRTSDFYFDGGGVDTILFEVLWLPWLAFWR